MIVEPAVPTVDLPRVNAAQFQLYDHNVHAYLVTEDAAMARWIGHLCSAAPATVAADIETRGLDVNKFSITCVSVAFQLGADTVALLLDPLRRPEHRKMLTRVFDHAARLVFHGASFDIAPLYTHRIMTKAHIRKLGDTLAAARMVHTNAKAGRSLEELAVAFKLLDDSRITMAKVFDARGLKKDDGWWSTDIDTPTYATGAMSDTVATLRLWGEPGVHGHGIMSYAARYLTSAESGFGGHGRLNAADAEQLVEDVQRVNAIILERTARGYAVDSEFPEVYRRQTEAAAIAAAQTLKEAGIRAGNGTDLVKVLAAREEIDVSIWPRTKTGQLKADKQALSVFTADDAVLHSELALAHRIVANTEKVRGYVDKAVDNARATGRLHPEIKILGASATGRMCLPLTQRLLTRRGIVAPSDIRVGDRTIDADGKWTTVRQVHRYANAPLRRYRLSDDTILISTPEHRWVTETATGENALLSLENIGIGSDTVIRLTPPRFDPTAARTLMHNDAQLATASRRAAHLGTSVALEAAAAYRREQAHTSLVEAAAGGGRTAGEQRRHMRMVRTRATEDRLRRNGLPSAHPVQWVLGASICELWALAHGAGFSRDEDQRPVLSLDDRWREAFAVTLYRLGVRGWGDMPALQGRMDAGHGGVWCVTTDSGTFTAWGADGPYLTGNSASKPEIQQFPKEARGVILADHAGDEWISADWKSIEPVVLATASGDAGFLADMRAGKDPYEPVGKLAGIDRKLAKRKMLADMYGQGHNSAALQFGWDLQEAKRVAWAIRDGLPILYRTINELKKESECTGRVRTLSGRVVDQRFSFYQDGQLIQGIAERIAPNHFCQGSALDIMHHAILELDRRGLSDHVHLWMHDEIVADAAIRDELVEVMSTPPPFLRAAAEQRGVEAFLAVDVNPMGSRWEYV